MSQKKIQEAGINRKRFSFDLESSDEESSSKLSFSRERPFSRIQKKPLQLKRISITENEDESADELDLAEILGRPQKRMHRFSDHCVAYSHTHGIYSGNPKERVHFWLRKRNHENLFGVSEGQQKVKAFSEEDHNSDDMAEGLVENTKLLDTFHESNFAIEDYLNFNAFSQDYFEQETVEDSTHIKDVKPYLLDSESEELGPGNLTEGFPNRFFLDHFRAVEDRMIE